MKITSYQTAFHKEGAVKTRTIEIPDDEAEGLNNNQLLDLAFRYGQNDFQPIPNRYSVSVGDIVELPDGSRYKVENIGFSLVKEGT